MAPAFVMLPVCLLAIGSMSPGAEAKERAVSGNRRFLAKAQSEGQQCGSSGSDGHFYGDCSSGLECVAPAAGSPAVGAPSTCQKVGQQAGQQCGSSGSDGHFYGDCSPGLACVPPADGDAMVGAPSICHKVCGSFGADGDHVNGTCSASQTCSGKAATPCREWAGECYMYCDGADRRLAQGEGQHAAAAARTATSTATALLDSHACRRPMATRWWALPASATRCAAASEPTGTMSTAPAARARRVLARRPRLAGSGLASATCTATALIADLRRCGSSGSDGHFYGDCSPGLACVPLADGDAMVGAPSICHKVCGSFGADGHHVNGTCSASQTCSGKAATPCREWAGECYMYCS
ncbi:unnamed protein product [Prorocentrum cordatum]|uniref:Uncharacterized protein n=1 Tax=Prorocentrum cordatum TaxID=2364126 RepID=A0ABN9SWU2_9DINO|nr:unnamed protein product [Polarella glacialis]